MPPSSSPPSSSSSSSPSPHPLAIRCLLLRDVPFLCLLGVLVATLYRLPPVVLQLRQKKKLLAGTAALTVTDFHVRKEGGEGFSFRGWLMILKEPLQPRDPC
jgi:hypothetical protein